jgi:hypothetical protein
MTHAAAPNPLAGRSLRAPVLWGVVWGVIQAAASLGFWLREPMRTSGNNAHES